MADLQAALDEYKSEVAGLDKQKTDLTREIKLLESKAKFLKGTVDDYEKAKTLSKISYDTSLTKLQDEEVELENKIISATEDLDAVTQQIEVAESELETLEQQHEQEIIGHNKRLASVKEACRAMEKLKNDAGKQVVDINKQIPIRQARLDKLTQTVKQAEADTENELNELAQLVESAKQRLSKTDDKVEGVLEILEDITNKIEVKKTELAKLEAKHQEFIVYEKRAMTALKSRESALLAGETELKVAIRRNPASVLDNLG